MDRPLLTLMVRRGSTIRVRQRLREVAANCDLSPASVASAADKGRTRSHAGGTERIDQLSFPYTKEEPTRLAETLRDFPVGELSYLMEHVRRRVADRPQRKATSSSAST
jgi:hypothetical protein